MFRSSQHSIDLGLKINDSRVEVGRVLNQKLCIKIKYRFFLVLDQFAFRQIFKGKLHTQEKALISNEPLPISIYFFTPRNSLVDYRKFPQSAFRLKVQKAKGKCFRTSQGKLSHTQLSRLYWH